MVKDAVNGAGAAAEGRGPAPEAGRWTRRADGTAARVVSDATGRVWRVWAAGCAHVPGAPTGDCLIFDAGEIVRRVWGAPPGWGAMSDAELAALAERPFGAPRGQPPGTPRAD